MRGTLPNLEKSHVICAGLLLLGIAGAGCGGTPDESKVGSGSTTPGATGGGGSGPVFGQGGTSGNPGGGGSSATSNGATGPTAGAGGGGSETGGATSSNPDAGGVSQCGNSFAGLGDCGAQTVGARIRHPNMLIVLDKSGSTQDQPAGFNVTIWEGLKSALSAALDGSKDRIAFGLDLFPAPTDPAAPIAYDCKDKCCQMPSIPDVTVPVEDGVTGVPKIVAALDATSPGGGTPTAAGLARAYDYYTTGPGATLDGDKYVLLATDGGPNCNANANCDADPKHCTLNLEGNCTADPNVNCCKGYGQGCVDDTATIDQINKLASAGIKTFVVGIPGSEAYSNFLDQFAVAGGATNPAAPPSYYRVDAAGGVAGLTKVFTDITTQLVTSCDIELTTPPRDPNKVNVAIDCQVLGTNGTDGSDGWILDQSTDPQKIVLQGTTCRWVQRTGAQRVDIVFGCPTVH
jgi:hypothetical protein